MAVDALVRLRSNRRISRVPGPSEGRGRRPKHGPVCTRPDPTTHGTPDRSAGLDDPVHGQGRVDVREQRHGPAAADAPFTVVRIRVDRLPRHTKRPQPLGLAWIGGPRPDDLHDRWRWPDLRSVVCIESTRRIGAAVSTEARHYLSSLPADAPLLQRVIRSHWGTENRLHWVLDLAFHEDSSRVRTDHAPENLAIVRHLALNLLRRDTSRRVGLKNSRFKAALSDAYLRSILLSVHA